MKKAYDCSNQGHITKLVNINMFTYEPEYYGCTECDARSQTRWADFGVIAPNPDHTGDESCVCFGCKAKGLQLNTGDARGAVNNSGTTQKKWDRELSEYRSARAQGIQPAGTTTQAVRAAVEISNKTGVAFDANTVG